MLAISLSISSCHKKNSILEIGDKDIIIKAQQIKNQGQESGVINYAIRLTPNKRFTNPENKQLTTEFWYQMDSCFYLIQNKKKIYPAIIQPIANAVEGTFEYYVVFDKGDTEGTSMKLVYQDKYLNKKQYELIVAN